MATKDLIIDYDVLQAQLSVVSDMLNRSTKNSVEYAALMGISGLLDAMLIDEEPAAVPTDEKELFSLLWT